MQFFCERDFAQQFAVANFTTIISKLFSLPKTHFILFFFEKGWATKELLSDGNERCQASCWGTEYWKGEKLHFPTFLLFFIKFFFFHSFIVYIEILSKNFMK